jgi:hypothetical protein
MNDFVSVMTCILMIPTKPRFFGTERPKGLMATDGMRATGLYQELFSSELRPWWFII